MPFTVRVALDEPQHALGPDSLRRDFGVLRVRGIRSHDDVTVRAVILPRVAIVDMRVAAMEVVIGRGALRQTFPHALCIVDSGTMTYGNIHAAVVARTGDVIMLGRETDQEPATYAFSDGFRGLWVLAAEDVVTIASPPAPAPSPLGASFVALLGALVADIDRIAREQTPAVVRAAEEAVSYVFSMLDEGRETASSADTRTMRSPLLTTALAVIARSAHDPETTPTTIARATCVSLSHLHRIFASHERTVSEELRLHRTRLAVEVLQNERLRGVDLVAISRSAGFRSVNSMRRAVISVTGLTPGEVRSRPAGTAPLRMP